MKGNLHEARGTDSSLAMLNDDVNQLERFLDVGARIVLQTALNVVLVGAVISVAPWQLLLHASCRFR